MKIETYEQRILLADENKWLCNHNAQTFSKKVYLGVNADPTEWVEVTDEEKEFLETEWEHVETDEPIEPIEEKIE